MLDHLDHRFTIEFQHGADPQPLAGADQRSPLVMATRGLEEQHLDRAASRFVEVESGRKDPGVVDDDEIPGTELVGKISDGHVAHGITVDEQSRQIGGIVTTIVFSIGVDASVPVGGPHNVNITGRFGRAAGSPNASVLVPVTVTASPS